MDQTTVIKHTLSQQVQECIDAGMSAEEGHQYVNIYIRGYALIANLIKIAAVHPDPIVRANAEKHLKEIDQQGTIGKDFRTAYRFTMVNKIKAPVVRKKGETGMRRLRLTEKDRIEEFIKRTDLNEDDLSEAKRIHASIFEDKVLSADYDKLRQLILKYGHHHNRQSKPKNGWRTLDEKTWSEIQAVLERPDVSSTDKKRLSGFLNNVENGKMETVDFLDATQIVTSNRVSKEERAKREKASATFENALFMACQACFNLEEMKMPALSKTKRYMLVAKISHAAGYLLQLQSQLVQEEDE
jgi:hypothetical protein